MNKFSFNHERKQWDRFEAFHVTNGIFTEFETGELVIRDSHPHPQHRCFYDKYGIRVVATGDYECPPLYLDKECTQQVKSAWLNQNGQQYLAVDEQQNVAVRLGYRGQSNNKKQHLAKNLMQPAVWMGPDRLPVPVGEFVISRPDRSVRKDLGPKLAEVRAAVRAVYRINPTPQKHYWFDQRSVCAKPDWADRTVPNLVGLLCGDHRTMRQVAECGFTYPRATTTHDFLYVKGA